MSPVCVRRSASGARYVGRVGCDRATAWRRQKTLGLEAHHLNAPTTHLAKFINR